MSFRIIKDKHIDELVAFEDSTFQHDLLVKGNTQLDGDLNVGGKFSLADPVTLNVPSADYPTIQRAIDYFNGRDAMNGTIVVAPGGGGGPNGAYVESLIINKWVSSRDNFRGQGFKIVGDNRNIMGTTFLQNGVHSNAIPVSGFGTDLAAVTLSNPAVNVIQVTLATGPQIDFALAGLLVGDNLKVRDNTGSWTQVAVQAIGVGLTSNQITVVGGVAPLVGTIGSAVVLVPNTELVGALAGQPTVAVENASLSFIGFWVNSDPAHGTVGTPRDNLFAYNGASVQLECCLFDNQTSNTSFSNVAVYDHSSLVLAKSNDAAFGNPGVQMPVTAIGVGPVSVCCYLVTDMSASISGALTTFANGGFGGAFVSQSSEGVFTIGQMVGGIIGFSATDSALLGSKNFCAFQCRISFDSERGSSAVLGLPGGRVTIDGAGATGNSIGVRAVYGAELAISSPPAISNVVMGVAAFTSANINVDPGCSPVFSGVAAANVITSNLAVYNTTRLTSLTPGNIFSYTTAPLLGMENVYSNQLITAAAPINIVLNPALLFSFSPAYIGKTFTVSLPLANSPAANNSTITLSAGAFVGQGGATGAVARFLGANSSITFLVESATTVRVLQSFNMAYP